MLRRQALGVRIISVLSRNPLQLHDGVSADFVILLSTGECKKMEGVGEPECSKGC